MPRSYVVAFALALAPLACSGPKAGPGLKTVVPGRGAPPAAGCGQNGPLGIPAEMITPVGATQGPRIDAPVFCDGRGSMGGAYVRVYGSGTRRVMMGPQSVNGACWHAPPPDAPPGACPLVAADALGEEMMALFKERKIQVNGVGLGVCGDPNGPVDFDAWRFSIGVTRWQDADAAIQVIDEVLRRWGVGHNYGLSLRGIDCVQLL